MIPKRNSISIQYSEIAFVFRQEAANTKRKRLHFKYKIKDINKKSGTTN